MKEFVVIGPPGCLDGGTIVEINRAGKSFRIPVDVLCARFNGSICPTDRRIGWRSDIPTKIRSRFDDNTIRLHKLKAVVCSGRKKTFRIETESGKSLIATRNHPVMTARGWKKLGKIKKGDRIVVDGGIHARLHGKDRLWRHVIGKTIFDVVLSDPTYAGKKPTFDLSLSGEPRNFLANGIVVHNTGKTHYIKRQVNLAAEKFGASFVHICSLTKTAAANIAQVDPAIPQDNIGTIHSLAYRAIDAGAIAESLFAKWNDYCAENSIPALRLSDKAEAVKAAENDDLNAVVSSGDTAGDRDLSDMNRLRAKMIDENFWPESIRTFAQHWRRWKTDVGCFDFTDLLEVSLRDVDECPGKPPALFVDESQDCSRLTFSLIRKWGEADGCSKFIHVGDPDQILFAWAGVDVDSFFHPDLPEDHRRILHQSFRVPRAVYASAVKWISQTPGRTAVNYLPRDAEGEVRRDCIGKHRDPMPAVRDCVRYIDAEKTVMFVATCSYMLNEVIEALRAEGIPYHNPFRVTRGDWNPLARGKKKTMALDRLLAFLKINPSIMGKAAKVWTNSDVKKWMEWIVAKTALEHGAKSTVDEWAECSPDVDVDLGDLEKLIQEGHLWPCLDGDPNWYGRVIPPDRVKQLRFPMTVIEKRGAESLAKIPQVVVTTIHAVKGGEADVVYLFPDLSPLAHNDWMRGGEGREGVRRAFYVGQTRARETLVLLKPSSSMSVVM